jgi:hypothetical protein
MRINDVVGTKADKANSTWWKAYNGEGIEQET